MRTGEADLHTRRKVRPQDNGGTHEGLRAWIRKAEISVWRECKERKVVLNLNPSPSSNIKIDPISEKRVMELDLSNKKGISCSVR